MPMPCRLSVDAGTLIGITTAPTVIVQATNSGSKPTRLKRIRFSSSQTGSNQQVVQLQLVTYATATSTGGTTPVAAAVDDALVGVYSPSTVFRCGTTNMGTTPTVKFQDQWNTANPYDLVDGIPELQDEFGVNKVWAWIIPVAPAAGFNLSGTLNFEEFG